MNPKTIRASYLKLTVIVLAFFIILMPVAPVFAQDTPVAPPLSTPSVPKSDATAQPSTDQTPSTGSSPKSVTDAPTIENGVSKPPIDPEQNSLTQNSQEQEPASVPRSTTKQLLPSTQESTGAMGYTYPIVVPPGRNGLQPDLKLTYNNQAPEEGSVFGSGWSTNIPYIERINRKGSEQLYSQNYFNSSLTGELVLISGSTWGSKVDNGEFLTYTFSSNTWVVKDKNGTQYKFGYSSAATRQDDPGDSSRISKWMLEEVRDTNDNYIKYTYYKDAGQIYPDTIKYTGNGVTDGIFEIDFLRQSRSDAVTLDRPGYAVTSNYRIYEIDIKVNGTWSRKYVLAYGSGANGARSLPSSITESGQDDLSVTTTLPATSLSYQSQTAGWTSTASWVIPYAFTQGTANEQATLLGDVNGDGLVDVLFSGYEWVLGVFTPTSHVYINSGSNWAVDASWSIPELFEDASYNDVGTKLADANGDGLIDILSTKYVYVVDPGGASHWDPVSKVYINSGTGWTYDAAWVVPAPLIGQFGDNGTRIFDVNGDGLPDILNAPNTGTITTYLNTGTGWSSNASWAMPARFMFNTTQQQGTDLSDVNGDGLADVVFYAPEWTVGCSCFQNTSHVWINNGNGWTLDASWTLPEIIEDAAYNDRGVRFADVNNDGLADVLFSGYEWDTGTSSFVWHNRVNINTGTGWTVDNTWSIPVSFVNSMGSTFKDSGTRIADINGDNIPDILYAPWNVTPVTYVGNTHKVDSLTQITFSQGGSTSITYKPSAQYMNGSTILNPNLPMILETVSQTSSSDGLGQTQTLQFKYEGGKFYYNGAFDRKFSSFSKVTTTDDASNKVVNYYHQGDSTNSSQGEYSDDISKAGKIYRTEITDSSGNIYSKTINKWDKYNLGTGRDFVRLIQKIDSTFDGDASHKDKAETYTYNNTNGNITQKVELGEVTGTDSGTYTDVGTDDFTTAYAYATDGSYIVGLPDDVTVTDHGAAKVKEDKYYYDAQIIGSVIKGNQTKREMWKTSTTYVNTQKTYNSTYGTVATTVDQRGKTTTYTNDTYNLYPASVTNPLTQVISYTYDYSSGKTKQITDPNTRVFQTVFDGLDRVIEEKQPDLTTPGTLVTKTTYTYTDTSGAVKVQKTDYLDASNTVDTYNYFDGLNRPIQVRKEMENANTYAVSDIIYNNIGQVYKDSLPYSSTGSAKTTATTNADLLTTYTYDPMTRITSSVNVVGTTSNAYNDWKQTVTDPLSKTKDLYKDAYDNLIEVDEHNGASTYTTNYEYNGNRNLTKITDALSNVRNFTYDGLGRRLTMQDLHAAADVTFGTWTYTYDDAGNLTQTLDPKTQTTNYTFDDVNRQLTEDYTGAAGTEVTNTYDSGTDGIGRLATSTNAAVTQTNTYNALGLLKRQVATLNAVNYQTDYDYDRQGNQINITNPDSSQVKNTYNTAGQLETVQRKESTDGAFINVVTAIDYGPHGKVTYQANANGTATTNTYDATKLYRLTRKQTSGPGSGGTATTTTFFPAAGDGSIYADNSTWATGHSATSGTAVNYTNTTFPLGTGKSSSTLYRTERGFLPFNTAALPDTAVISSARLKVLVDSKLNNDNDGDDWVTVTQGSQAGTASLVVADFDNAGTVTNPSEGIDPAERKDISNVTTGQYLVYNLNNTGKGWISKTGNTLLALREGHDVINSTITATTGQYDQLTIRGSEYTGTTSDPVLEVSYYSSAPAPTVLQDSNYTYDNNGNILTITDSSGTDTAKLTTYVYDDLNRLSSATVTSAANSDNTTKTYTYDAIGNIASSSDLGTYTYAGSGYTNPHAVSGAGSKTYSYDNNGNLTGDGIWTNTWDYQNRMTQAVNGSTVTYAYDPTGQRVKVANGTTTYYPSKSYNTDGTTPQKHIFANGALIATVKGTGASASITNDHTDQLTGVGPITNSSGAMVQLLDYHPYGTFRIDSQYVSGIDEQRKEFGQEFDRNTGLSYMNGRYYNPAIGRFISQDLAFLTIGNVKLLENPQALNSYSYANNNPLINIDPNGKLSINVFGFLSNSTQTTIGNWSNNLSQSNSAARLAMDHPYAQLVLTAPLAAYGVVVAAPYLAAVARSSAAAPFVRSAALGAAGGVASQAISDMVNGNVSSAGTYASSASRGAAVGISAYAGGPIGAGISASSISIGSDILNGRQVSVSNSLISGTLSYAGAKLPDFASKISGRLPNPGSNAFYFSRHAQQEAIKEGISTGLDGLRSLSSGIFSQLKKK